MPFWGKKKSKDEPKRDPLPGESGWDSFALALASGAGIIAVTVMEIEFFPALILGEVAGSALVEAQRRHDDRMALQHDWHMSLIGQKVDHFMARLIEKPLHTLTDKDRIHLALLTDWGLIAPEMEAKMKPELKAEVLHTQLTISAEQQGISTLVLAEKFAYPRMSAAERATPEGYAKMEADRARMKAMLIEAQNTPSFAARMRQKFGKTFVGKVVDVVAKDIKAVGKGVGLAFEYPSLRKVWDIVTAKGPATSAEEFMDRMAKGLQSTYEGGLFRSRCAQRRDFRKNGVAYESVLVPKPEGGKRHIVRRKHLPPAA